MSKYSGGRNSTSLGCDIHSGLRFAQRACAAFFAMAERCAVTVVLIVLLIYRSTLTMHEDNQLFLEDSSSHMQ